MQEQTVVKPQWRVPVRIRVGQDISDAVRGPEEALNHLTYRCRPKPVPITTTLVVSALMRYESAFLSRLFGRHSLQQVWK
jgi:hypothetical protein